MTIELNLSTVDTTITLNQVVTGEPLASSVRNEIVLTSGDKAINLGLAAQGPPGRSYDQTYEIVSKNISTYPASIGYINSKPSTIIYDLGSGMSITKTLNWSGDELQSIVLSGDTPSGIDLTKTLVWTDGVLTGVEYS